VSIAIKNSIAPDVELLEPNAPATEAGIDETSVETEKAQAPQEQPRPKEVQAPRTSRRSSTSKKESRKEVEATQN